MTTDEGAYRMSDLGGTAVDNTERDLTSGWCCGTPDPLLTAYYVGAARYWRTVCDNCGATP